MIEGLSEEEFLQILVAAETIDGVLFGGQELNLWANVFMTEDEFESLGPFTSKDIDFWGNESAARDLAQRLNGRTLTPREKFGASPSSASVEVKFNDITHQIDFIYVVSGLNTQDFLKRTQEVDLEGIRVAILHPMDVLRIRIAGMTVLKRSDPGAIRQLRAAPWIVTHFIEQ